MTCNDAFGPGDEKHAGQVLHGVRLPGTTLAALRFRVINRLEP